MVLPTLGAGAEPESLIQLAVAAEEHGWQAVLLWDAVSLAAEDPDLDHGVDAWLVLAAIALATRTIRLGTYACPLSRRRPWKVAREAVTLDRMSGGRLILGVGPGARHDAAFTRVNEPAGLRERTERMDEALAIITGLWSGQPVTYHGRHFDVDGVRLRPGPLQRPRIPIWVIGAWPRARSMRRAVRWDGVHPIVRRRTPPTQGGQVITPRQVRALDRWLRSVRGGVRDRYDIVVDGATPGGDPARARRVLREYEDAGAGWWFEVPFWSADGTDRHDRMRRRIEQGPPPHPLA
ncbi:MAG: LLM class flavin-dependent oxidoreductase [Mycobacteriales bacterium]